MIQTVNSYFINLKKKTFILITLYVCTFNTNEKTIFALLIIEIKYQYLQKYVIYMLLVVHFFSIYPPFIFISSDSLKSQKFQFSIVEMLMN